MGRIRRRFLDDPADVGTYHCINRCVRRSFLCGTDQVSGKNYDHRKQWIQDRLQFLARQFGIDILGFAVMSNHIHVILRNRPDAVKDWSDEVVARRWWNLCPMRRDKDRNPKEPTAIELQMIMIDPERFAEIRRRLSDVSWFMRFLVEPLARIANKEDSCSGRFWEGRFKCQKLLDEAALVACLAYVDLNPIRARIAETPETSQFTSVYERIQALEQTQPNGAINRAAWLSPFELVEGTPDSLSLLSPGGRGVGGEGAIVLSDPAPKDSAQGVSAPTSPVPRERASNTGCLPMSFTEYLNLLDWTGRQLRADKRGAIPQDLSPILERLHIDNDGWLQLIGKFCQMFRQAAGRPQSMQVEREQRGCQAIQGIRHSRQVFI